MRKSKNMEDTEKPDEVKEIELPKAKQPCAACGKMVTPPENPKSKSRLLVCDANCMDVWKKKNEKKDEAKEIIEEANNSQEAKKHRITAMKKSTKTILIVSIGALIFLLLINMFWFNASLSKIAGKDMNSSMEVNTPVTVNSPDIPITNNYENNNPVTVQIDISDEIADIIADEVISIINSTNFTS